MFALCVIILIIICLLFIFVRPIDSFGNLDERFYSKKIKRHQNDNNESDIYTSPPKKELLAEFITKLDNAYQPHPNGNVYGYWKNGKWYDRFPSWAYVYPYYIDNYDYSGPIYSCSTCNAKSERECSNCINCGFCRRGGVGQCVEGNSNGPLFNNEYRCDQWWYAK